MTRGVVWSTERRGPPLLEMGLVFIVFALSAFSIPPDVNEAHYLAKARHYWNPDWCAADLFLDSADAHRVFYWTFGWIAAVLPLPAAAWVGRLITWLLLAWSWTWLSWAFAPRARWSVFSAGCFAALLDWGHMAGEWVLGGVEAKGFAFVLMFLGLESLVRRRWSRTWLLLGGACSFHVLVGGWSVVAALVAWLLAGPERPSWRSMIPALAGGLLLSLPGLLPALALNRDASPEVVRAAEQIYVFRRLPHHLVFHLLPPLFVVRHLIVLLAIGFAVIRYPQGRRQRRLLRFLAGALLIASVGIAVDLWALDEPARAARLLRLYWFRLSDVAVPLSAALVLLATVRRLWRGSGNPGRRVLAALVVLMVVAGPAHALWTAWADPRPPAVAQSMPGENPIPASRRYRQWREMCRWVANHTPADALFLTPRYQQSFKWYAERAEVANWKDIPQDARGIIRWWRAMTDCYTDAWRGLAGHGEARLIELSQEYGFQYIVLDRTRSAALTFPRVYPESDPPRVYEVYQVPER